jgi:O-ureido-D-serine cyclo-ligase
VSGRERGPYVALATATAIGKGDFDMPPLLAALAAAGVEARVLAWDDPAAEAAFAGARACVLRSTWNYVQQYERFLAWIDRCARVTRLLNPAPVVRWNSHKGYLLELEGRGIPIVPTRLVRRGGEARLADLIGDWPRAVVKPAVSAGSFGTIRVGAGDLADGQTHLDRLLAERDMLVQRYEPSVEAYGERSLIWLDGAFTHAVRKSPRFSGDREDVGTGAVPIAPDERALAERVLSLIWNPERVPDLPRWDSGGEAACVPTRLAPGPLLYARVDLVRDPAGQPCLMELELIEPSLFFDQHPGSAARMAAAIARL